MVDISEHFYIIGHRGAAGEVLENTLEGFEHAIALGVDAIELDVREHSSRLWVFHDRRLERLTDATGYFREHPDPGKIRLQNGAEIPTLDKVLDLAWGKIPMNIEIKSIKNLDLLLDLFARYNHPPVESPNGLPWILVSSFNHPALMQLHQRACPWPLAPIIANTPIAEQIETSTGLIGAWSWHFDDEYLDFYQISRLRELGIPSLVYTVNDPVRMEELRKRGIAGIFTDLPTEMLKRRAAG
jgi:glycerophosphoryl diester phosphodiesterase